MGFYTHYIVLVTSERSKKAGSLLDHRADVTSEYTTFWAQIENGTGFSKFDTHFIKILMFLWPSPLQSRVQTIFFQLACHILFMFTKY
jgi:hypothetical protein